MMNTHLLHALPAEQARCRELVRKYVAIGSAGAFASALIEHIQTHFHEGHRRALAHALAQHIRAEEHELFPLFSPPRGAASTAAPAFQPPAPTKT